MLERVARSRIEIDAARLIVLNAAIKIDESNPKGMRYLTPNRVIFQSRLAMQSPNSGYTRLTWPQAH